MKKLFNILLILFLSISLFGCEKNSLPLPEVDESRPLNVDKNINEETIDNYLNRKDTVYIDLRMDKDEANFEAIDGDSYLSGFIKGFKVIPYPYICNVVGLPEEVGSSYSGDTLYTQDTTGYLPNYSESLDILKELFPRDKNIFLMCGGGGYANMMKEMLVALGWDTNKIYNVGGYWYYNGKNSVSTKYEENGETKYNFDLLDYHTFDFSSLTKIREQEHEKEEAPITDNFIKINSVDELNSIKNNVKDFILYVYLPNCVSCKEFHPIVEEFQFGNKIDIYSVSYLDIKTVENEIIDSISYAPSVFIYKDGVDVAHLDITKEEDKKYFESLVNLSSWIDRYIDVEILKSNTKANVDCNDGDSCKL